MKFFKKIVFQFLISQPVSEKFCVKNADFESDSFEHMVGNRAGCWVKGKMVTVRGEWLGGVSQGCGNMRGGGYWKREQGEEGKCCTTISILNATVNVYGYRD